LIVVSWRRGALIATAAMVVERRVLPEAEALEGSRQGLAAADYGGTPDSAAAVRVSKLGRQWLGGGALGYGAHPFLLRFGRISADDDTKLLRLICQRQR